MILVKIDLDFSLKSVNLDSEGRSIIMEAKVQGSLFLFANIYAPNKVQEQCRFFENLNKNIEDFVVHKEHRIIVGGDFNVTLDSDLDCSGGKVPINMDQATAQSRKIDFAPFLPIDWL